MTAKMVGEFVAELLILGLIGDRVGAWLDRRAQR